MAIASTQYQSYLLRLWSTGDNSNLRATLLNVHNPDEQHHFATLDELTLFLNRSFLNESVFQRDIVQRDMAGDEIEEEAGEEGDVGHRGRHRY